jgi:hypothetical protein
LYRNQLKETIKLFIDSIIEIIETDKLITGSTTTESLEILTEYIQKEFDCKKTRYGEMFEIIGSVNDSCLSLFESERDILLPRRINIDMQ